MKKLLPGILAILAFTALVSCGTEYEVALITDLGPVDDKSFNQGAWEGVLAYAEEHDVSHKYYRPAEDSAAARLDAIALAVKGGAKIVVCPGFLFGEVVFEAQDKYPETSFILLDADPHDASFSEFRIEDNVMSIYYAEEQGGFQVGYAAVKDGYTNLGFFGGVSVPAVVRYGIGFIQGADYAAVEDGVDVSIKYKYLGSFDAMPEYKTLASSWYSDGTEVIFVAAGGSINNAISAAEEIGGKKVIGCNVDQKDLSDVIITSSLKQLAASVKSGLEDFYGGRFMGGEIIRLDAAGGGVGIPDDYSRFSSFDRAANEKIFGKLVDGSVKVSSDIDVDVPEGMGLRRTTVTVVE